MASNRTEGCLTCRDTDNDQIPDWQDLDSDDDGISDSLEKGGKDDKGACEGMQAPDNGWPCDTDADGVPDYLDSDSDGDGLLDKDEDLNGDGQLGCCLASCNKPLGKQHTCLLTSDGCGNGQTCAGGTYDFAKCALDSAAQSNSNVTRVREASLGLLRGRLAPALARRPIGSGAVVAASGSLTLERGWLRERLAALGACYATRLSPEVTHVILGERPGWYGLAELGLIPVLEPELVAHLAVGRAEVGEQQPDGGAEDVARRLLDPDEATVLETLKEMRTTGVPDEAMAALLVVCQDVKLSQKVRKPAKQLFGQYAPAALQDAVRLHLKTALLGDAGETKTRARILALQEAAPELIHGMELARLLQERAGRGLKYIFTFGRPDDIREALARRREGHRLELGGGELDELPEELAELTDLKELDLTWTPLIGELDPVWALTDLEVLSLAATPIVELDDGLTALTRLRVLDLSENRLRDFPLAVTRLPALEELNLGGAHPTNGRRTLGFPEEIGNLTRLRKLDFYSNEVTTFPAAFFTLAALEELNLSCCTLPDMVPDGLARLTSLRRLKIFSTEWATEGQLTMLNQLLPGCEVVTTCG